MKLIDFSRFSLFKCACPPQYKIHNGYFDKMMWICEKNLIKALVMNKILVQFSKEIPNNCQIRIPHIFQYLQELLYHYS